MSEKVCRYCGSTDTETKHAQPSTWCNNCGRGLGYYEYAREWQIDDMDAWLFEEGNA